MKVLASLCLCLWLFATVSATAQPSESLKTSSYTFHMARLVLKDGTAREGWFLGSLGDSMVIRAGASSSRFSRHDLLRVDIEIEPDRGKPALIGMLSGVYLGNALFVRAENQPTLFFRGGDRDLFPTLIYETVFGLVGGGVGYLVGMSRSHDIVFDFSGGEGERALLWKELCDGGAQTRRTSTLHFSIQGSWVSGPLPDQGDNFFGYSEAGSLNMMRKIQLAYSLSEFFDVGLAVVWLGQPSVSRYSPGPPSTVSQVEMSGRGAYAVGVIQPLWKLGWRDVQWDVGVGVGIATVDFKASSQVYDYYFSPGVSIGNTRTTFSALINTELKVFITDHFSIGLAADLAYVPEDVPNVQGITYESKTLGTRSVGFVLGLHL